ncbi:MAG: trimethylamine methyltransferase [Rhodospirillales bacterium]|nr:trimethylamine methyltransferase [Rhodospirillales bacterium]
MADEIKAKAESRPDSRRRGGGRKARRDERQSIAPSSAVGAGHMGGTFKPLSDIDVENIHQSVLEVLSTIGVGDPTQELLDIALPKGCVLSEEGRLLFPTSLMEDILSGAAKEYTVHGRGSRKVSGSVHTSDHKVHYVIAGQAVTTFDAKADSYRPSVLSDIYDFARLVDTLEHVHMAGVPVVAGDISDDPLKHDINCAYSVMSGTEKPFSCYFSTKESLGMGIEMFDHVLGGEGRFEKEPFAIFGGCPILSPLNFGEDNLEILIETSRRGLVSDIAVAPQAGATAPASLAGALVQVVSETLASLAVVNLVNPGCGMTYAGWPFVSDLRTGSFSGGSGEEAILAAASVQIGNWYGLPTSVAAGMTDSKVSDAQSGYEKGITAVLASLAGCNRVSECVGMMGSLMGLSFENAIIDNDMLGMAMRTVRGIEVNEETMAVNVIRDVAHGAGHYLGHQQTLGLMQTEFLYPNLADRQPQGPWAEEGSLTIYDRARDVVHATMTTHFPDHIPEEIDAAIRSKFPIALPREFMKDASGRW